MALGREMVLVFEGMATFSLDAGCTGLAPTAFCLLRIAGRLDDVADCLRGCCVVVARLPLAPVALAPREPEEAVEAALVALTLAARACDGLPAELLRPPLGRLVCLVLGCGLPPALRLLPSLLR